MQCGASKQRANEGREQWYLQDMAQRSDPQPPCLGASTTSARAAQLVPVAFNPDYTFTQFSRADFPAQKGWPWCDRDPLHVRLGLVWQRVHVRLSPRLAMDSWVL